MYKEDVKSKRMKKLSSILAFITRHLDLKKYEIKVFEHCNHKTVHIEIWRQWKTDLCQPLWVKEWYPIWEGSIILPGKLLK